MCHMTVANFLITATRAIDAPRLRLIRLNHSRRRLSCFKAWYATCASSQRAMLLPALVMLPMRLLLSLLRQPGVSPQKLAKL